MTKLPQSEELILTVARTTLTNARDNQPALAKFGVTVAYLDELSTHIMEAENMPVNEKERIDVKNLTMDKDEALDKCNGWGKDLRIRLEFAFGKNSPQVREVNAATLAEASRSETAMIPVM